MDWTCQECGANHNERQITILYGNSKPIGWECPYCNNQHYMDNTPLRWNHGEYPDK